METGQSFAINFKGVNFNRKRITLYDGRDFSEVLCRFLWLTGDSGSDLVKFRY